MNNLPSKRILLLSGVAVLLFGILVARLISGWGLVTVHVKDAPLGKVIASIARQGHVTIETSLDPTKLVSLDVDRVPAVVAIDTLAIRADTSWRLVYLTAPTKQDLSAAVLSMKGGGKIDGWTTYDYHSHDHTADADLLVDPRYAKVTLEGADQSLPVLLNQASQKSGVVTAFPKDWTPIISRIPSPNQVRKIVPGLASSAHGASEELFFLAGREHKEDSPPVADEQPQDQLDQPPVNHDWIEQRTLAQIELLPPEKKVEAKQELEERKAFFAEIEKLPRDQRKAKFKELMANPDVIDKISNYKLMRDAKMSADQRISRAVSYLSRKSTMQGH